MLCFEIHRNGEKLCTAGIGEFGVLTANVSWVAHNPEKLARWVAKGITEAEAVRLQLSVGGLTPRDRATPPVSPVYLKWVETSLASGDEIKIRLVNGAASDPPLSQYQGNPATDAEQKKEYVRSMAKELGWEIREQTS